MRTLHTMLWLWQERNTAFFLCLLQRCEIHYFIVNLLSTCVLVNVYDCRHVVLYFWGVLSERRARERERQENRLSDFMCNRGEWRFWSKNMLLSQSAPPPTSPHIPVPVNALTMCGNLFDPYRTQKQMSWNATDTVWIGNDRKSLINVLQDWQPARLCFFL